MRSLANERIGLCRRNAKLARDAREIAVIDLAKLANFLPVSQPVAEQIDGACDDRVRLDLGCHGALPEVAKLAQHGRAGPARRCDGSNGMSVGAFICLRQNRCHVLVFILTVLLLELTPGPNMAYLATLTLDRGGVRDCWPRPALPR